MFKSTVLKFEESKKVIGGKQGPYGECWFGMGEWWRADENSTKKSGLLKRCDEK